MTETQIRDLEKILRKIHRTIEHLELLSKCQELNILPNFTILSKTTIKQLNLKTPQILNYRNKIFNDALQKQHCDLNHFILLLNNLYDRIYLINSYSANGTISVIKSRIKDSEFHDDQQRKFKLEKLRKAKASTF